MVRVSLRVDTLEVPAQDVVTRDNVTVKVNAVIYFRVIDPRLAVVEVSNFLYATSQLAQTTLRSVLGEVELDELLSQREKLNVRLQSILDQHTSPWGVKVTMVEVKQVDLAEQMIRAIARQAEAERERRAKIIHAEGEYTAAEKLAMAAEVIQKQPAAIQLRYLQTLVEIGAEKNTTIVFPLPLDIIASLGRALDRGWRDRRSQAPGNPYNMRNNETGEFELVVGNRQLLSGFFIVVLLFAVAFAMGYVVGRELAALGQGTGAKTAPAAAPGHRHRGCPAAGGLAPSADAGLAAAPPPAGRSRDPDPGRSRPRSPRARSAACPEPPAEPTRRADAPARAPPAASWPAAGAAAGILLAGDRGHQPEVGRRHACRRLQDKGFPAIAELRARTTSRASWWVRITDTQSLGNAKTDLENAGFQPWCGTSDE